MLVLVNKDSGGGTALKKWADIRDKLKIKNGFTESFYVGFNQTKERFIRDALQKGKTDFVIAGGDGSINYFLNQLLSIAKPEIVQKVKIGTVGIGSSNDFHKPFAQKNTNSKIPYKLNFKEAVHRDVGSLVFEKDGQLYRKYFLINASIGVTAEGNNFFNNPDSTLRFLKKFNTQSAINYAAIRNIFSYKNFTATVKCNGESFKANITNMGVIKCPFFSGSLRYHTAPSLNNGLFDVHLYHSLSRVELIKLFYKLNKGICVESFNKKFWRTNEIKVSSQSEFTVEFDGEVIKTRSVEFIVIPRLIQVCIN